VIDAFVFTSYSDSYPPNLYPGTGRNLHWRRHCMRSQCIFSVLCWLGSIRRSLQRSRNLCVSRWPDVQTLRLSCRGTSALNCSYWNVVNMGCAASTSPDGTRTVDIIHHITDETGRVCSMHEKVRNASIILLGKAELMS
jgi:hypothetical protein